MLISALAVLTIASSRVLAAQIEPVASTVQMCWAFGDLDDTVYYAEAREREDRSESFDELLRISGVEHTGIQCMRTSIASYDDAKSGLLKRWHDKELEIVDTTFMSDDN